MNLQGNQIKEDDLLIFEKERDLPDINSSTPAPWKVLIVDDDKQIHMVTTFALKDISILNRKIEFLHAYDSVEAFSILQNTPDITVILLDVVMETDTAGLDLVKKIRDELGLKSIRIILRTGQPGFAPELEVIQDYDINDYKMKSELTRTRLITSLTTAIRSYEQYVTLAQNKNSLEQMIKGSESLFSFNSVKDYCRHVIDQISLMIGSPCDTFLCSQQNSNYYIIAADGFYREYLGLTIDKLDKNHQEILQSVFEKEISVFTDNTAHIFLQNDDLHSGVLVIQTDHIITDEEQQLLKVYGIQVSVGFGNQYLLNRLHQYAYFDQLSKLPNRTRFLADIKTRQKKETDLCVAIIDVNQFSEINNALGYQNGDLLLQAIAKRLIGHLSSNITIARIGSDIFGVLGPEKQINPKDLTVPFNDTFIINGTSFPIKVTIGLAKLDPQNIDSAEVLKNADMAMKIAKGTTSTNYRYYTREMDIATQNRIIITRDLRNAVKRDELILHFQPQLNLSNGDFIGVESLIRWQKPGGELIPPGRFIPIAEQSGLIIDIGEIALRKTMEFMKSWISGGNDPFRIGVNVSVKQFHSDNFLKFLSDIIAEYSIDPTFIELEITESMLMQDVDRVISILKQAKKLGLTIAIDDFGTGYSSLNYLLRLPIDRLKIDRSFVMDTPDDADDVSIVQAIIALAHGLKMHSIAEGVETTEQLKLLKDLGCNEVQGFLFSKALPSDEILKWLTNFNIEKYT